MSNYLYPIEANIFNSNALNNNFQALYLAGGLPNPCVILRIQNASNRVLEISFDGVNLHEVILVGDVLIINAQTVALPNSYVSQIKKGTQIYGAAAAGAGVGLIYISGYYIA